MVQEQEAARSRFAQQQAQIEASTAVIKAKGEAESINSARQSAAGKSERSGVADHRTLGWRHAAGGRARRYGRQHDAAAGQIQLNRHQARDEGDRK